MNGFYITVSNGLLEPKHVKRMGGGAVFLYMWFLDHMTSVSEDGIGLVLGGKPVISKMINLGISHHTYLRWLDVLCQEPEPYIKKLRTPRGYVIEVFKAKKVFNQKSDIPEVEHHKHSDVPNMARGYANSGTSDVPEVEHAIRQDSRQDKDSIYTSMFVAFWEAYPKKVEKLKAFNSWEKKKIKKEEVEKIMAFVQRAKNTRQWKEGYVPNPTTFINGERWNDDLKAYGELEVVGKLKNYNPKKI